MEPGDKALIHEGVYHEQIMGGKSGKERAPITYEGTDRSRVLLKGSVRIKDWINQGNTWVKKGLNPITHENAFVMADEKRLLKRAPSRRNMPEGSFHLERDGTYTVRMWNGANPNTDHELDVYELDFAFNSGDRWGGTSKKWVVLRNLTLEKYGTYGISTDKRHPGDNSNWELDRLVVRYNHAEGVFHCLDGWYVHDCAFVRNGIHGCQINGAKVIFEDNLCAENEWFGPSPDGGCGLLIGPDETAHSCEIRNNVFENNGADNGYGCGVYLEGRCRDNVVEENLILGGTSAGICFFGSMGNLVANNILVNIAPNSHSRQAAAFVVSYSLEGPPTQAAGNLVAHNTAWGCPAPVAVTETSRRLDPKEGNRFVNNLFFWCRSGGTVADAEAVTMAANGWFSCPAGESGKSIRERLGRLLQLGLQKGPALLDRAAKKGLDPGLVNPARGDFRLRQGSPLIDAGTPIAEVTRDREGNPRPIGSSPDIGAYEYAPKKNNSDARKNYRPSGR